MTRLFRILEIAAITAMCLLAVFAVAMLSWLLVAVIHSNTHGGSLLHSVLIFCALVVCAVLAMVMAHCINESRHGK